MIDCRNYALRLLSIKDRTEKEIKEKLTQKGFDEITVIEETEFLREYGYINDERYAQHFTNDAINLKKWGKIRVLGELSRRGIDREIAEKAVEKAFCEDSSQVIEEQIRNRFKNSDLGNFKERKRIFDYFMRRGYSPDEIKGALNRVCSFDDIEVME